MLLLDISTIMSQDANSEWKELSPSSGIEGNCSLSHIRVNNTDLYMAQTKLSFPNNNQQ